MYIYPSTERIKKLRKNILELVLSEYPKDRIQPEKGSSYRVSESLSSVGIPEVRYPVRESKSEIIETGRIHIYGLILGSA